MRAGQCADEKLIRDAGNYVRDSDGLVLWRAWAVINRQDCLYLYDFVARISGEGPGASSFRTFLKPASSSHSLIWLKLNVSPFSVLTSICTENISEGSGLVRSSFTSHSAMAIVPPDFKARKVFLSN